jgi:hypothetical protein
MNTKTIPIAALISLSLLSFSAAAHDPSLHKKSDEKPNCAAMKDMDHTEMETDDPVMRAMMAKCRSERVEAETVAKNPLPKSKTKYRKNIGHDAPMLESAPEHERQDHRKTYEVADCENMSNMHHSSTDWMDPITQEMMEQCEDKAPKAEASEAQTHDHE